MKKWANVRHSMSFVVLEAAAEGKIDDLVWEEAHRWRWQTFHLTVKYTAEPSRACTCVHRSRPTLATNYIKRQELEHGWAINSNCCERINTRLTILMSMCDHIKEEWIDGAATLDAGSTAEKQRAKFARRLVQLLRGDDVQLRGRLGHGHHAKRPRCAAAQGRADRGRVPGPGLLMSLFRPELPEGGLDAHKLQTLLRILIQGTPVDHRCPAR